MTSFLDQRHPMGVAHRGSGEGPAENSPAAIQGAVDLGFECVEIAARLTADGHIVVCHDPTLSRLAGRDAAIDELTLEELRAVELADGQRIPTLAEFLTSWPQLHFLLDVKRDECIEPLARLIADLGVTERVCIHGSVTDGPVESWFVAADRMRRVRELLGAVVVCTTISHESLLALVDTGQLPPGETGQYVVVSNNYDHLDVLTPSFVETAHAAGVRVIATDHGDLERLTTLVNLGVDGFLTDLPDILRDRLRERGQWPAHDRVVQDGPTHA